MTFSLIRKSERLMISTDIWEHRQALNPAAIRSKVLVAFVVGAPVVVLLAEVLVAHAVAQALIPTTNLFKISLVIFLVTSLVAAHAQVVVDKKLRRGLVVQILNTP